MNHRQLRAEAAQVKHQDGQDAVFPTHRGCPTAAGVPFFKVCGCMVLQIAMGLLSFCSLAISPYLDSALTKQHQSYSYPLAGTAEDES